MKKFILSGFLVLLFSFYGLSQTTFTKRWIVIVPAAIKDNVNTRIAAQGAFGNNTFSVPLYTIGNPSVITHYACNWQLTPGQRTAIETYCRNNSISAQTIWSRLIVADLNTYDSRTAIPTLASVLAANNLGLYRSQQP